MNTERIVDILLEGPDSDLLSRMSVGAIGFGGFMKASTAYNPYVPTLARRWGYKKNWVRAGVVDISVYDYGPQSDRPNSIGVYMEWNCERISTAHTDFNMWNVTPAAKAQIVYIMHNGIKAIERTLDKADAEGREVWTYNDISLVKGYMEEIFSDTRTKCLHAVNQE